MNFSSNTLRHNFKVLTYSTEKHDELLTMTIAQLEISLTLIARSPSSSFCFELIFVFNFTAYELHIKKTSTRSRLSKSVFGVLRFQHIVIILRGFLSIQNRFETNNFSFYDSFHSRLRSQNMKTKAHSCNIDPKR